MTTHRLKSLFLGLDGATWGVLLPLLRLGIMPNLASAIGRGTRGILHSTHPPLTGPSWTSIATGKNPGQHGYFDWGTLEQNYRIRLWNARDLRDKPVWQRLSEAGRRVGVVNYPFTYPPEPLHGFMICGMGTPARRFVWAYPPELYRKASAELPPGYSFNFQLLTYPTTDFNRLVTDLLHTEQAMTAMLLRQLDDFVVDDLFLVFTGPDRVGHFLGHRATFDEVDSLEAIDAEQEAIVRYYRVLDDMLEPILDRLDQDGILTIVSDHGFTPINQLVHINEWLQRHGYLHTKPLSRLKANASFWLGALNSRRNQTVQDEQSDAETGLAATLVENRFDAGHHLGQVIDWSRTRAFSCSINGIYINRTDRFSQGIVGSGEAYDILRRALIEDLLTLSDPLTGDEIVERVYLREEIYSGDRLDEAPDLIMDFAGDRYGTERYFFGPFDYGLRIGTTVSRHPSPWSRSNHHRDGIFVFAGPPFSEQQDTCASVEDIAPTLLYALGQSVPSGMDGHILLEAFTEAHLNANRAVMVEDSSIKAPLNGEANMSTEEENLVYERLRALGYME